MAHIFVPYAPSQIRIQNKDDEIQKLQKALDSIEAEAVVNQEEIRKELMEVQNELFSLKEYLLSSTLTNPFPINFLK